MISTSSTRPLNAAQNQHLSALAASVSDSERSALILCILATTLLALRVGSPKQLAGLNCKKVFEWVQRTPYVCSYEAVRKLLKHLVDTGLAEFRKGKYILADSVEASLRGLADPRDHGVAEATTAVNETGAPRRPASPGSQPSKSVTNALPASALATPVVTTETTENEINQRAIKCFVEAASLLCFRQRSSLYWQVACCRNTSIGQLAAAASGLATAIMSGRRTMSPGEELQAIIDGKSEIKPTSAASFVFAYEAYKLECAAESKAIADAAVAKAFEPLKVKILEMIMKRLAPQQAQAAAPEIVPDTEPTSMPRAEEERPLAPIYRLPVPGDYGDAG